MGKDVFISYARADYEKNKRVIPGNIVSAIKKLFDDNGITYWFDEEGIYTGSAFTTLIAQSIKEAKLFLFISTANSNASPWTSKEIGTAYAYGKPILPFKYDSSIYNDSVILYLANLDYIEYQANPEKAMERLLLSVNSYLQRDVPPTAPATPSAPRQQQSATSNNPTLNLASSKLKEGLESKHLLSSVLYTIGIAFISSFLISTCTGSIFIVIPLIIGTYKILCGEKRGLIINLIALTFISLATFRTEGSDTGSGLIILSIFSLIPLFIPKKGVIALNSLKGSTAMTSLEQSKDYIALIIGLFIYTIFYISGS